MGLRRVLPVIRSDNGAVFSVAIGNRDVHKPQNRSRWPFATAWPIPNSAPQWPHRPCNAPTQPYRVGKKPSVKVDLAICSQVVDASGQYMSVSLILLGCNLDFSSCDNLVSFYKSSHILQINFIGFPIKI